MNKTYQKKFHQKNRLQATTIAIVCPNPNPHVDLDKENPRFSSHAYKCVCVPMYICTFILIVIIPVQLHNQAFITSISTKFLSKIRFSVGVKDISLGSSSILQRL